MIDTVTKQKLPNENGKLLAFLGKMHLFTVKSVFRVWH